MCTEEEKQHERHRIQAGAGRTGEYHEAETAGWYVLMIPLFRASAPPLSPSLSLSLKRSSAKLRGYSHGAEKC